MICSRNFNTFHWIFHLISSMASSVYVQTLVIDCQTGGIKMQIKGIFYFQTSRVSSYLCYQFFPIKMGVHCIVKILLQIFARLDKSKLANFNRNSRNTVSIFPCDENTTRISAKFRRKIYRVHSRGGWRFGIYFRGYFQSTLSFNEISSKLCVTRIVGGRRRETMSGTVLRPFVHFPLFKHYLDKREKKEKERKKDHLSETFSNRCSAYFISLKKHFLHSFHSSSFLLYLHFPGFSSFLNLL